MVKSDTRLQRIEGQSFGEGDTVLLDGKRFVRCVFKACDFTYGGGELAFEDCTISGKCHFEFVGAAHRTITVLEKFGYRMSSDSGDSPAFRYSH